MVIAFSAVMFFSVLAFWKYDALLFMITAGASVMTGLYWRDTYTTNIGLSIGILLIIYGLICLVFGIGCLFKRRKMGEG